MTSILAMLCPFLGLTLSESRQPIETLEMWRCVLHGSPVYDGSGVKEKRKKHFLHERTFGRIIFFFTQPHMQHREGI